MLHGDLRSQEKKRGTKTVPLGHHLLFVKRYPFGHRLCAIFQKGIVSHTFYTKTVSQGH